MQAARPAGKLLADQMLAAALETDTTQTATELPASPQTTAPYLLKQP